MTMTVHITTGSDLAYIRLLRAGYRAWRRGHADGSAELLVQCPQETTADRDRIVALVLQSDPTADVLDLA